MLQRLKEVRRHYWIIAGTLVSLLVTLYLGVYPHEKEFVASIYHGSGFYFMLGSLLLWVVYWLPKRWNWKRFKGFLFRHRIGVFLAVLLTTGIVTSTPPKFRILADETNLLGVASAMYDSRSFHNPTQRRSFYNSYQDVHVEWGKRPILYPTFVYLSHTVLGYDGYNGFIVNNIACFFVLFLFYFLIRFWMTPWLGWVGMSILAAYPLYILGVRSSGFEILNLALILLAFIQLGQFLKAPSGYRAELLTLTLILLAQVRYESILFTIIFLPIMLWHMRKRQFQQLSIYSVITPFLFLPIIWQRILNWGHSFQMENDQPAFSLRWVDDNMIHAWDFFSGSISKFGNIPLVFFVGMLGGIAGLVILIKNRAHVERSRQWIVIAMVLSVIAQLTLLWIYYWGNLTLQYAMRLGIVYLPVLILGTLFVIAKLTQRWEVAKKYVVVGCVGLIVYFWPIASKNEAVNQIFLHRIYDSAMGFLHTHYPDPNILIVSDRPGMYVVHRWGAISFGKARQQYKEIPLELSRHLFQDVIALQFIQYRTERPEPGMELHKNWDMDILFEKQINGEKYLRISKLKHSR